MKVLMVTNQYPSHNRLASNPIVGIQANGLKELGVEIDIYLIDRVGSGRSSYFKSPLSLFPKWNRGKYDLMHVQFGGIQALIGAIIGKKRTIITFHGTDLHGGYPTNLIE
jgi:hypothetical protein